MNKIYISYGTNNLATGWEIIGVFLTKREVVLSDNNTDWTYFKVSEIEVIPSSEKEIYSTVEE